MQLPTYSGHHTQDRNQTKSIKYIAMQMGDGLQTNRSLALLVSMRGRCELWSVPLMLALRKHLTGLTFACAGPWATSWSLTDIPNVHYSSTCFPIHRRCHLDHQQRGVRRLWQLPSDDGRGLQYCPCSVFGPDQLHAQLRVPGV